MNHLYAQVTGMNTLVDILVIPYNCKLEDAMMLTRNLVTDYGSSFEPFSYKDNGISITGLKKHNDNGIIEGEVFCFTRDGFTVIMESFDRVGHYKSIREIVRTFRPRTFPLDEEELAHLSYITLNQIAQETIEWFQNNLPSGYSIKDIQYKRRNVNDESTEKQLVLEIQLNGDFRTQTLLLHPLPEKLTKFISYSHMRETELRKFKFARLLGWQVAFRFVDSNGEEL